MKAVAIIQARTGSTRLPGKVLKPILGEPMLARMLERVKRAKEIDHIIVATSEKSRDDAVAELATRTGVGVFRGSEDDVLDRVYRAAKEIDADVVVCLTGDCVLHDPSVIDEATRHFIDAHDPLAYAGTPANYPEGLDTDIFAFSALEEAAQNGRLPSEREHLAQYFKNRPERFHGLPWTVGERDDSAMHWSVDTEQDFEFATKIFEELYPANPVFGKDDILALLARKPGLLEINKGGTGYEGLAKTKKKDEVWKGLMKRLTLGTVQLGKTYGLDDVGQPTKEESFAILDAAYAAGITTFDTAGDYGNAVDILGEWVSTCNVAGEISVLSKLGPRTLGEHAGEVDAATIIRADVEQTLRRLKLNRLSCYLLNNSRYVFREDALHALRAIKQDGLAERIGVSVYDEDEALEAVRQGLDCVEVPYNAFDQRLDATDFWPKAKEQGTTVFARSPFLQGVLLMSPEQLPANIAGARPYLEEFIRIAREFNLSQMEAALLFSLHATSVARVVFGVKTLAQLEGNLASARASVPDGFIEAIRARLQGIGREIVNPMLWKQS